MVEERSGLVPSWLARSAAWSWRLLVVAAVGGGVLWLVRELRLVVFPVVAALFLTRVLSAIACRLRARGVRPALAAWLSLVGFLGVLVLAGYLIVPAVADQFADLGPTVSEAVDDVERWVVEDAPVDLDRGDVQRFREQLADAGGGAASTDAVVSGAVTAAEVVAGTILTLVVTFFFVKEGRHMRDAVVARLPVPRRQLGGRLADRAWDVLGGYLRGAAALGVLEAAVIGTTLALVGASLALPVMVLTFLAAFVPLVGAVLAGVVAVLVTLATASPAAALVVAGVAIVVQQLDNDLLAPVIYGRALALHPLAVLLSITAGGALFGLAGTFLAVPTAAVLLATFNAVREDAALSGG